MFAGIKVSGYCLAVLFVVGVVSTRSVALAAEGSSKEAKVAYHQKMVKTYGHTHRFMAIKFPLSAANPAKHERALLKLKYSSK